MEGRTWFTARQKQFLDVVAEESYVRDRFYLTGGTALSGFYYNHRESLDIDLFTPYDLDLSEITHLLFRSQKRLKWIRIEKARGLGGNNFILHFPEKDTLRVDFFYYTFEPLKRRKVWKGLKIDSLEDIATNKLDMILSRKKMRDYVDLYFLMNREKYTMERLRRDVLKKFDWKVEASALVQHLLCVNELSDMPKMNVPFSVNKMIRFFENEARKLKPKIFTP